MWKCPKCGTENIDSANGCQVCSYEKPFSDDVGTNKINTHPKSYWDFNEENPLIIPTAILICIAQLFLFIASCIVLKYISAPLYISYCIINALGFVTTLVGMGLSFQSTSRKKATQYIITYLTIFLGFIKLNDLIVTGLNGADGVISIVIISALFVTGIAALLLLKYEKYFIFRIIAILIGLLTIYVFLSTAAVSVTALNDAGSDPTFLLTPLIIFGFAGVLGGVLFTIYAAIVILKAKSQYLYKSVPQEKTSSVDSTKDLGPVAQKLKELKELREANAITEEEYQEKRKKYIDSL